jgi:acyl-CoA synthetase (AMP-forming)/AMP-acid ligase II
MPLIGSPLAAPIRLPDLLRFGLEGTPDAPALVALGSRVTWRELEAAATNLASNLLALGLRPGDRVASLMPNRIGLLTHYIGCMKAGLVAVPLNYRYMPPEIDHALEASEAAILLAHAERDQDLAASRLAGGLKCGQVAFEALEGRYPSFEALVAAPAGSRLPEPDPTAPAFIFFTSGSTGPAKGVTHSVESIGWLFAITAECFELTPRDVVLRGSSLSHMAGFAHSFAALSAGARVLVARTFDSRELLGLLREEQPTVLGILPATLFSLVRDHSAARDDFHSLRFCMCGGDKMPPQLAREFTELTGLPIHEGYGMTESGLTALSPPSGPIKQGSVGRAAPGMMLSIRDRDGNEVPTGEQGVLWVKSPSTMVGYWNDPAATAVTMSDGWLDTGDIMRADSDGYLYFCGRKKQIIVRDGSNIAPQEVEEALLEHDAVESAGVVGVRDLLHGEKVCAFVTVREGTACPTKEALIAFAHTRIGYKAPEEIVLLKEMPLSATGKVDRAALKKLAKERLSATAGTSAGANAE